MAHRTPFEGWHDYHPLYFQELGLRSAISAQDSVALLLSAFFIYNIILQGLNIKGFNLLLLFNLLRKQIFCALSFLINSHIC